MYRIKRDVYDWKYLSRSIKILRVSIQISLESAKAEPILLEYPFNPAVKIVTYYKLISANEAIKASVVRCRFVCFAF